MNLTSTPYTSLWYEPETDQVFYIDQTKLPWELVIREMKTFEDGVRAIADMEVRGAPLIGVAAGFALYLGAREYLETRRRGDLETALREMGEDKTIRRGDLETALRVMGEKLIATRPTAVNLAWAVTKMLGTLTNPSQEPAPAKVVGNGHMSLPLRKQGSLVTRHSSLLHTALAIRAEELTNSRLIGEHGMLLIKEASERKPGKPVNILTHCNAGWLATVDYGTALAPIYLAHDSGIPVHVWVDETRPRNQGAKLTAFELTGHGVPNTLIVDNAGGHLMQQGMVDMVIVGADRITANGDVVNKIGTYLKALAAFDNHIPFYVAAPSSTFDYNTPTGKDVPIEERSENEVLFLDGTLHRVAPAGVRAHNPGFDITPARLVTAYITEKGKGSGIRFK